MSLSMHMFFCCFFRFSWIFKLFILSFSQWVFGFSLSMQMFDLHSPITCFFFFSFLKKSFFMGFHILDTLTLQPGFRFSLYMHIWFPLSKQMLDLKCLFFIFPSGFFMGFHIFYTFTLQAVCKFSLSMQMFGLYSPSSCLLFLNMFLKLCVPVNKNIFFDLLCT